MPDELEGTAIWKVDPGDLEDDAGIPHQLAQKRRIVHATAACAHAQETLPESKGPIHVLDRDTDMMERSENGSGSPLGSAHDDLLYSAPMANTR
jgi:hypothetical protein